MVNKYVTVLSVSFAPPLQLQTGKSPIRFMQIVILIYNWDYGRFAGFSVSRLPGRLSCLRWLLILVSLQYGTCFSSPFWLLNFDVALRCLAFLCIPALWYETLYSERQFQLPCIFIAQLRNIHLLSSSRLLALERVALLQDVSA